MYTLNESKFNAETTSKLLRRNILLPPEIDAYLAKLIAGSSHINPQILFFSGIQKTILSIRFIALGDE